MKNSNKHITYSRSTELKPTASKKKISSFSIDTNSLFKSEYQKEFSKFASNQNSRDVSYIRDRFPAQLPHLIPTLPTDIEHLKQLYQSSDNFGIAYSMSSSNLLSPQTCKKPSCMKNVLMSHNHSPTYQEDFGLDSIERLNLGNPAGRQDILHLKKWLEHMKETHLSDIRPESPMWSLETIERAEIVYIMAGKEIVRQVSVHCVDRGEVLKEILWFFNILYKRQRGSFEKESLEITEKFNKLLDEKTYRNAKQIAYYDTLTKQLSEANEKLRSENIDMFEALKISNRRIKALQDSLNKNEIKQFMFTPRQSHHAKSISSSRRNSPTELKTLVSEPAQFHEHPIQISCENDKSMQTEQIELLIKVAQSTQTEFKERKYKYEFRPRFLHDLRANKNNLMSEELTCSIQVLPIRSQPFELVKHLEMIQAFRPSNEQPKQETRNSLSNRPERLVKAATLKNKFPMKRHSLVNVFTPNFKSVNSQPPLEKIEENAVDSVHNIDVEKANHSNKDLLIQKIIVKQRKLEEITAKCKASKAKLNIILAKIDERQNELSEITHEAFVQQLEIQNGVVPNLKKLMIEKYKISHDVKVRVKEATDTNEISEEIDANLEELIASTLDIASWKAGFNAGFEKGLASGLTQGEELGIEVGEDMGYVKSIRDLKDKIQTNEIFQNISSQEEESIEEFSVKANNYRNSKIKYTEILNSSKNGNETINRTRSLDAKGNESFQRINSLERIKESKVENNFSPEIGWLSVESIKKSDLKAQNLLQTITKSPQAKEKEPEGRSSKSELHADEKYKKSKVDKNNNGKFVQKNEISKKTQNITESAKEDNKIDSSSENTESQIHKSEEVRKNKISKAKEEIGGSDNPSSNHTKKSTITININEGNVLQDELINPKSANNNPSSNHKQPRRATRQSTNSSNEDRKISQGLDTLNRALLEAEKSTVSKQKEEPPSRRRFKEVTKVSEFNFTHQRNPIVEKQTNLARKLIEKFFKKATDGIVKKSKMSKRMAFKLLNSIYQSYSLKIKAGEPSFGLLEHTYEEFLQKYSLKAVCEKKMLELISSLLKFSNCRRALMYLKLTNLSKKINVPGYSESAVNIYMMALNHLINSKVGIIIAIDETAEKIMIPFVRASECAKEILEGKMDRAHIGRLLNKLESAVIKDPKKINPDGLVEAEFALEEIVEAYEFNDKLD